MPSTYTNNLGIQKPANGEQSGTWGETVNANSDILDNAINGVLALTLSGTSSTLTTANGVASNGQYKVLVLGGSPSGTHTITIDPNTAQKLYFVNNLTAQSVVITQGSGGSVTLVTNSSAVIYADGAGAAAKVTNLTNSLAMSATKITGGSITGITDLAVADGGTGASDAAGARTNLGLGTIATQDSSAVSITGGSITGIADLAVADGGTGSSTAVGARTNLGLGTISTQASSAVAITGGSITGITDLAIADGGTGSSTAAGALTNFGLTATAAEINVMDGITGIATQAVAEAGTNNTTLMTPLRVAQAIDAQAINVGIGAGQTWSRVNRTAGTAYQNTTGKAIMYTQSAYSPSSASTIEITAAPTNTGYETIAYSKAGTAEVAFVSVIIPSGWYYKTSNTTSTAYNDSARELK